MSSEVAVKPRGQRESLKVKDVAENRKRRAAAQARRMDVVEQTEEKESVLQDSEGLKAAAIKASNGGRKRIVGLYLPTGNRMDTKAEEVKADADHPKVEEKVSADKRMRNMLRIHGSKGKTEKDKSVKERDSYNKVVQTYHHSRKLRKDRCDMDKVHEDELDDDEQQRRVHHFMSGSAETDMMQYNDLFKFFDVDGDRNWGSIEFAQRMTDIGFSTNVEDAANLLYFAGVRDVDRITYNDFMAMMPKLRAFRRLIEKDAQHHFSRYDEGTGYISKHSLKQVILGICGPDGMHHSDVDALVKKADREKTGWIPFDFFILALFGSKPLIQYKREARKRSLADRLFSSFRCCGTIPAEPGGAYDEEDDDAL